MDDELRQHQKAAAELQAQVRRWAVYLNEWSRDHQSRQVILDLRKGVVDDLESLASSAQRLADEWRR